MWATAVYDYGLTEEQFWELTPAQYHALGRRFDMEKEHNDYGFGTIASILFNAHKAKKTKARNWVHFYPQWEKKYAAAKKMTPQEMKEYFKLNVVPYFNARAKADKERAARKR